MTQGLDETVEGVIDLRDGAPPTPRQRSFLRPGEVFGPWKLLDHVADGGFGTVWRASAQHGIDIEGRTVRPGENAALKFFGATTEAHQQRIVREVALASRLGGQWTPEFYGADLDAIPQWAAFEFITDATLRDLVRSTGPLSGRSLEVFAEDLWDALAFFRLNGVAHRDLTPANIHVNAQTARPRVIDWGNAHDGLGATYTAYVPRTPGYAAPEQVEGRETGPAADLWSWAAVVCFAATGHPPFPVEGYHQRIVTCDVPLDITGVPSVLLPALDAAFRWDPADRDPDLVASHLPGRQAHVHLEAARARASELDETLDDLDRRMRLRDERIEELAGLVNRYERQRGEAIEVAHRLSQTEAERDEAARDGTALRARVAELENELQGVRASMPTVGEATAALREARFDAWKGRLELKRLRWRNRRLERRSDAARARRHHVETTVPLVVASIMSALVVLVALNRATWESLWLPVVFCLPAGAGVWATTRITARSRRREDQARAGLVAAALMVPFLAPLLFSAGAIPSRPLATWAIHAPFPTSPPPDGLGVGHGAKLSQVDDGDCTEPVPQNSYWDVIVVECDGT